MFEKVSTDLNFVDREKIILDFWAQNDIFKKSIEVRKDAPVFTFYEGPPTANGKPHIGHVITRAVKDAIPRYRTMKGYKVLRKAGWDTQGLPVELEVEKNLGMNGKQDIEKYGVEPFIKACKESVWKYEKEWRDMSERVGFWADMDNPYVTFHNEYIESVWWAIKQIWDKGLIYKGHKVVPYCPRCGTALSSHEVAQGYKDVKENSIYVTFKIKNTENDFFLVWTTTPWTLPSNVALAVNGKEKYVKVFDEYTGKNIILAEALCETALKGKYNILETFTGVDLERKEYEPLFDFVTPDKPAYFVTLADFVTLTDGSGIVHIAPAFGEDDNRVGKEYDLPFVQMVDDKGLFIESVKPWAGVFVKSADKDITKYLKSNDRLYSVSPYEHSYPFCWRCDTPLLYYARESWFIKMTAIRDRLLYHNNTINWLPDNIRTGRFGAWLENVIDWGFSRERYWGTPLPLWICDCGHVHAVGGLEELKEFAVEGDKSKIPGLDVHKPYIDEIKLSCPKCKKEMKRTPEVIDCWFDSGSMPFAQWHYPFENQDIFNENFPADYISEAVDQTRGWFYVLLAISTLVFDKAPYKNVIVLGHIQDKNGQKMSKSKGNMVQPWDYLNKQGADAVRWYFYTYGSPWLSNKFNEEMLNEGQRKYMGTLWNAYAFFVLYANIDGFDPKKYTLSDDLSHMDKWVLSRLNTLIKTVDNQLEKYHITEASRALAVFVDELSNWYIRRCRERFWESGMEQDKINAYMTLYTVLVSMAKLSAPFTPFMSEGIYQNLVRKVDNDSLESVHLEMFPTCDEAMIDPELEKNMDGVLKIVERGRAARNSANVKNRQAISKMYVKAEFSLPKSYYLIIMEELNVKEIVFTDEISGFTSYKFKPQLKTLGKKFGKLIPAIGEALANGNGSSFMDDLKKDGTIKLDIAGEEIVLSKEDLLIEESQKEGFAVDSDRGVTVALNTTLTQELIEEGFVREVISKLQNMRKEAKFEVTDKIEVCFDTTDMLKEIILKHKEEIMSEVLAEKMDAGSCECLSDGFVKNWSLNGEDATLAVAKI